MTPIAWLMLAALSALKAGEAVPAGWMTEDGRIATDETKRTAMASPSRSAFNIPLYASPHQPAAYGVRAAVIEECAKLTEARAAAQSQFQKSAYSRGDDIGGHGHWKAQCELLSLVAAIRALSHTEQGEKP